MNLKETAIEAIKNRIEDLEPIEVVDNNMIYEVNEDFDI